ncbi:hypothetical protein J2W15_002108 [Pseudarthrobacter sulfonivorans]|nr:hypothetical protein [Pseudarthrobacter sulfonivorans]
MHDESGQRTESSRPRGAADDPGLAAPASGTHEQTHLTAERRAEARALHGGRCPRITVTGVDAVSESESACDRRYVRSSHPEDSSMYVNPRSSAGLGSNDRHSLGFRSPVSTHGEFLRRVASDRSCTEEAPSAASDLHGGIRPGDRHSSRVTPGVIHSNIHIDFHRLIHRYDQPIIEIRATRGNVRHLPSCAAECTPDHIQSGSRKIPLVGSKTRAKSVIYGRFAASGNDCSSSGDVSRETRYCPGESRVCFAYERR